VSPIQPLIPRQPVPALEVPLAGGGTFRLSDEQPEYFTMIVFYRGRHCPVCAKYLADLHQKLDEFAQRGVSVVAISSDSQDRAEAAQENWKLPKLRVGYGLNLDEARKWGLYISTSRGKTSVGIDEPPLFIEPGLFLVRPDQTLYFASVQTMPHVRPNFAEILTALDRVIQTGYPARGEVVDHHAVLAAPAN
jgi:peroxiredoxin